MKKIFLLLFIFNFFIFIMFAILYRSDSKVKSSLGKSNIQNLMKFEAITINSEYLNLKKEFENNKHKVVINLWATWCKPCLEEITILNSVYDSLSKEDILFIAIACDESKISVEQYLNKHPFKFKQIHYSDISTSKNIWDDLNNLQESKVQIKSLPMTILYDHKSGKHQIINGSFDNYLECKNEVSSFFNIK